MAERETLLTLVEKLDAVLRSHDLEEMTSEEIARRLLPLIREHAAGVARSIADPKSDTPDQLDIRYTIFKALERME